MQGVQIKFSLQGSKFSSVCLLATKLYNFGVLLLASKHTVHESKQEFKLQGVEQRFCKQLEQQEGTEHIQLALVYRHA